MENPKPGAGAAELVNDFDSFIYTAAIYNQDFQLVQWKVRCQQRMNTICNITFLV